jgi:hypothetical protein
MFNFERHDNGFVCCLISTGHTIAHLTTGEVERDAKTGAITKFKGWPVDQWQVHFTGYKLLPGQLQTFLDALPGLTNK